MTLSTLHKAKGLEWPVVFIGGCVKGKMPMLRSDTEKEEEDRLAYVGITRAKDQLHISHFSSMMAYGTVESCEPSPYIQIIKKLEVGVR